MLLDLKLSAIKFCPPVKPQSSAWCKVISAHFCPHLLVSLHHTVWLQALEISLSQFWRPEVWKQGVSQQGQAPWEGLGDDPPLPLPAFGGVFGFHWHVTHHSSLYLFTGPSSLWVWLSVSLFYFLVRAPVIGLGLTLIQNDLIITNYICKDVLYK